MPVEPDKTEGPADIVAFLGMELDTQKLEIRLPSEKLVRIRTLLEAWKKKKAATKKELQSLIGLLSHTCKAVRAGRSFLRRLIDLSTRAEKQSRLLRLNLEARSDLEW